MKKKILVLALMVLIFTLVFAFSVSAENIIKKLDTLPTLEEIRANPSNYVSHLDAFDTNGNYKSDPNSVVVLCDQQATPAYYVFPSSYIITSGSYTLSFTNLNSALSEADSTVFASYARNGGRGGSIYMIRIEVPTYVTTFGYDKFESATKLKEIYFPTKIVTNEETGEEKEVTYFSSFSQADFFNGSSSLEVIHNLDKVPTTSLVGAMFSNCSSLKVVDLPNGITNIPVNCFSNCKSLTNVTIPSGVTSISRRAFSGCSSLTEIILPNSLTTLGKAAFESCSSLETVCLGASFATFSRENADYETFTGCNKLKYVYLPATFADSIAATNNDYKSIFNSTSKVTYFFVGDYTTAQEALNKFIATNNNKNIASAVLEEYNPATDYTDYASTKGTNMFIWNYNNCEAFYNGEHIEDNNPCVINCNRCNSVNVAEKNPVHNEATEMSYERYDAEGAIITACTNEGCKHTSSVSVPALFICRGYSAPLNGNGSVSLGFALNRDAINAYSQATGKTLEYGVFAVAQVKLGDNDVLNADGSEASGVIKADVSKIGFDFFEIKITGFETDDQKDAKIAMGAYVIATKEETKEISYIQESDALENENYYFASYNDIVSK